MTLHYKVWLAAIRHATNGMISSITTVSKCGRSLQEEITALSRYVTRGKTIWLNADGKIGFRLFYMRSSASNAPGIAVTDLRFLIEMRGIKALGGKILHIEAADQQDNVAPELCGHRSETELDSPRGQRLT